MYTKTTNEISEKAPSRRTGRGARVAGLTLREAEVLRLLHSNRNKRNTPHSRGETEPGWCRPMDLGGCQQSHHSNTLTRLTSMGFVDMKPYLSSDTHSRVYRMSDAGQAAWALYAEHQRHNHHRLRSQSANLQPRPGLGAPQRVMPE
jgi:hypothetical protein